MNIVDGGEMAGEISHPKRIEGRPPLPLLLNKRWARVLDVCGLGKLLTEGSFAAGYEAYIEQLRQVPRSSRGESALTRQGTRRDALSQQARFVGASWFILVLLSAIALAVVEVDSFGVSLALNIVISVIGVTSSVNWFISSSLTDYAISRFWSRSKALFDLTWIVVVMILSVALTVGFSVA